MKYLSSYTEAATTELFNTTNAFFAFSTEQFTGQRSDCKYYSLGGGLYCPQEATPDLLEGLATTRAEGIAADIAENGILAIIHRELGNYEAQITGDISEAVSALSDYGITESQVQKEYPAFFETCVNNDWF